MSTATQPKAHTVDAPGATVTYDVREAERETDEPALLMIASPMSAKGFESLAPHFSDRTVVTYDPRGTERSPKDDPTSQSTPEEHADDLHRVISAIGGGPVDVLGSSGGALNALPLVAEHPEQVRTLVAHEPPAASALPDREEAQAAAKDLHETYQARGLGPAMAKFMFLVMHKGPVPADFAESVNPDPAEFGLPTEDDGSRDDPLLGQNMLTGSRYEPDYDALRGSSTRVVIAVGEESEGEYAHRGGLGVAENLGTEAVVFPSHHAGFLGGEFGQMGDPPAFAAKLREVLAEEG